MRSFSANSGANIESLNGDGGLDIVIFPRTRDEFHH
jgi:hypothetical protein